MSNVYVHFSQSSFSARYSVVNFQLKSHSLRFREFISLGGLQLRDTLSTSWSVGRGTGAFIYALSADETSPALAAPRHAITALFSCRFKCPCPPQRQRHFHSNAGRAYNTLHFASQSRVPNGALPPLDTPTTNRRYAPCREHTAVCCQQPVSRSACSSL